MYKKLYLILFICGLILQPHHLQAQVIESDSLALVDLYNQCNGVNWNYQTNWLTNNPVGTWDGVAVNNTRVSDLDLSSCGLTGNLPDSFTNLTGLILLDLSSNQLVSIPDSIGKLQLLNQMFIYENLLSYIPADIGRCNALRSLFIDFNPIDSIPEEIGNLENLNYLGIAGNRLTSLPLSLGNLKNLKSLYLNYNQLTELHENIGNMDSLTVLTCDYNSLTTFPASIGNLKYLRSIRAIHNQITHLPAEIGSMTGLEKLYLDSNQLSSLPDEMANLGNFGNIHLTYNQFTEFPLVLTKLPKLYYMDLSFNPISGELPDSFYNMTYLARLYMHHTNLSGAIKPAIGDFYRVNSIELNNNKLTGAIPSEIALPTDLDQLYIYNNQLTDLPDFPSLGKHFWQLEVNNNKLTFEDLEPNMAAADYFLYSPQAAVGDTVDTTVTAGRAFCMKASVGGTANHYQWYKNTSAISGATDSLYCIDSVKSSHAASYHCKITNAIVTGLTLSTAPVILHVNTVDVHDDNPIPSEYRLYACYPNPFNPATTISYDLKRYGLVKLQIYNCYGQPVRTLASGYHSAGHYEVIWDGRDDKGNVISSGIYIYRLSAGSYTASGKTLFLK